MDDSPTANAKVKNAAKSVVRREKKTNLMSRDFTYFQDLFDKTSRNIQKISNYFDQQE